MMKAKPVIEFWIEERMDNTGVYVHFLHSSIPALYIGAGDRREKIIFDHVREHTSFAEFILERRFPQGMNF